MEGKTAAPATVTGSHRASFNSAYATLEQSIRNFSKEKLMYEQTIEGLQEQITMAQDSFQKLNLDHQDLVIENKRLMAIQEENQKTRVGVDALVANAERKQQIIEATVEDFEKIEQNVTSRYEVHEEFLYCLKLRQTQLVQCMEQTRKQNESLRVSLEDGEKKYATVVNQLSDAYFQIQVNSTNFAEEKSKLHEEFQEAINEQKKSLLECNENLQLEKTARKELEVVLENVQDNLQLEKTARNDLEVELGKVQENLQLVNTVRDQLEVKLGTAQENLQLEKTARNDLEAELGKVQENLQLVHTSRDQLEVELGNAQDNLQLEKTARKELEVELEFALENLQLEKSIRIELEGVLGNEQENLQLEKAARENLEVELGNALENLQLEKVSRKDVEVELGNAQENLQLINTARNDLEVELGNAQENLQRVNTARDQLEVELGNAQENLQLEKTARKELEVKLGNAQENLQLVNTARNDLEVQLGNAQENLQRVNTARDQLEVKLGNAQENLQLEKTARIELEGVLGNEKENLQREKTARNDLEIELGKVQENLQLVNTAHKQLEVELGNAQENLQLEKTARKDLEVELGNAQENLQSSMKEVKETKELMEKKMCDFVEQKETLIQTHSRAMDELEQEYQQCKDDLKAMRTRFADQKKAISQLVEETNARPIILPSKAPARAVRAPPTPTSTSQERLDAPPPVTYKALSRGTPSTPGRPRISAPVVLGVESPKSRGILKRPSDSSISNQNKNVSFGPTYVTDFLISSSSDTESSSGEVYRPSKDSTAGKRIRLTKDKKDKDANEDLEEADDLEKSLPQGKSKEKSSNKERRFFRKEAPIAKSPITRQ